ncbi:Trm112 family protein [Paracidobacterium acidisoli]|uniref:Trm112 family protein n=1 Tax=Paracidobacterium acidisoli TaxID=2303751 RepID=A0A372INH5_9BACT|nr:Trm112 family protein [Paracidobacterium acidisoli]MBT9332102.1 Trm112 family protein [Paracidobacterium acidisoli]
MRLDPLSDPVLKLIVCPACHEHMAADPDKQHVICSCCGRRYPVEDGLPVLLMERAARTDR